MSSEDAPRVVTVVVSAGDASTTTTDATPIDLAARDGVERAVIANKDVAMSRLNALFGTPPSLSTTTTTTTEKRRRRTREEEEETGVRS